MKKIQTKKAAEELGRRHAETINKAFPLTWQEVDAMEWRSRNIAARAQIGEAPAEAEKFADAYVQAAVDAQMKLWYQVSKAHDTAVKNFERACQGLTHEQAVSKVKALLEDMRIRGARISEGFGLSMNVTRAWAVEASLHVKFDLDRDNRVINPDNDRQCAGCYTFVVELSWSSTTRRLSDAVASVKLYQELTEAAAEIEAVMSHERVVWTFGLEEEPVVRSEETETANV